MGEIWHDVSYRGEGPGGAILAEAGAPAASLWFDGHFPGEPVLPAIAILDMVAKVIICHEAERGRTIRIDNIRKVRFRLPVGPGDFLKISVSSMDHNKPLAYSFKVLVNGDMACSGIIAVVV